MDASRSAARRHATGHPWKPALSRGVTARAVRMTSSRRRQLDDCRPLRCVQELSQPRSVHERGDSAFNARMRDRLQPTIRNLYADADTVVIFFDATGVAKNGEDPRIHTRGSGRWSTASRPCARVFRQHRVQRAVAARVTLDALKPEHRRRGMSFQTIQSDTAQGLQYIPRYPDGHLNAQEMIDRMIEIVPAGTDYSATLFQR